MAYYGRDPKTIIEEQKKWEAERKRKAEEAHKKKIRVGPATSVYRAPKPLSGPPGRAFKPGEFEETMLDYKHFYDKKNLASDPLSLGPSALEGLKKKQAKVDTRSKKLRKKVPVTYSLKSDPVLRANREIQEVSDAKAKPTTNMRDYKTTLKLKKENYFGGKTKKRRRKKKRKTRRKNKRKKTKRKFRKKRRTRKKR